MAFGCFSIFNVQAYRISGNLSGIEKCMYPKVYLEVIDDLTDHGFYSANANNLIAEAWLDSAGNFVLEGNEIPDEPMFYRLYVTHDEHIKTTIYTGATRNYMVVVLSNASNITVNAPEICNKFFEYTVSGSGDCAALSQLQQLLDGFERIPNGKPGETKERFAQERYLKTLFAYADSTPSLMAGIRAVIEAGISENYITHKVAYDAFIRKFSDTYPASVYTQQLNAMTKLQLLKEEHGEAGPRVPVLTLVLGVMLVASVLLNIFLFRKMGKQQPAYSPETPEREDDMQRIESLIQQLTIKEREILMLVDQGLSNKEIAEKLNVELSTVKTHVSRIYQKLNIKSRREVSQIARYIPKSAG